MMRAIAYAGAGGPAVVEIADVAEPAVGSNDALVEVAFAGLNRADLLERAGRYAPPPGSSRVPGLEFSGIVRSVGARVAAVAPGDRVCGLVPAGAHAQRFATDAATLARVPDGLPLRAAAAIPEAYVTAHDALFGRARFALGDSVLIHAIGSGVGLAALALARRGGGIAYGTSRTPEKLERALALGLTRGFTLADGWVDAIHAVTGGRGVDVVLDFAGGETIDADLNALATRGRIVSIGTMAGASATISLATLMVKRGELHGTVLRSRPLEERIVLAKHLERALLPLFARGELVPQIDSTYALDDARAAHEHMERDGNFGKILIEIGGEP